MQQIDFLPAKCRQRYARRRSTPWQMLLIAGAVATLVAAALSQAHRRSRAREALDEVTPQYELAVAQNAQLAQIQAELKTAQTHAELLTYLRHPWPRTQLLWGMMSRLPDEITLEELQITQEASPGGAPDQPRSRAQRKAEAEQLAGLSPAARDLKRLRDQHDGMQTVVLVSGVTTDSAAVHRYLGVLASDGLFAKAELDSSESVEGNLAGAEQFHARLVVRAGYGQPDGPTRAAENTIAQTGRSR